MFWTLHTSCLCRPFLFQTKLNFQREFSHLVLFCTSNVSYLVRIHFIFLCSDPLKFSVDLIYITTQTLLFLKVLFFQWILHMLLSVFSLLLLFRKHQKINFGNVYTFVISNSWIYYVHYYKSTTLRNIFVLRNIE